MYYSYDDNGVETHTGYTEEKYKYDQAGNFVCETAHNTNGQLTSKTVYSDYQVITFAG